MTGMRHGLAFRVHCEEQSCKRRLQFNMTDKSSEPYACRTYFDIPVSHSFSSGSHDT